MEAGVRQQGTGAGVGECEEQMCLAKEKVFMKWLNQAD